MERSRRLDGVLRRQRAFVGAALVILTALSWIYLLRGVGLYQLSSLKHSCLRHCRGPVAFLVGHWRPGRDGALEMGALHGGYCVVCCWLLMALLFAGGVMNLLRIVLLTLLVVVEKRAPFGDRIGRIAGLALVAGGAAVVSGWVQV